MRNDQHYDRQYITVPEAARILGISRTTGYKRAKEFLETGIGLPCIKLGRLIRVPLDAFNKLINAGMPPVRPTAVPFEWQPPQGCLNAGPASRDTARSSALPVGAAAHADDLAVLRP